MIQNGIGDGELAGGCFISTYMFKIDHVGTIFCSTSFWTNRLAGTVRRRGGCPCYGQCKPLRLPGFGLYHRSEPIARLPDKQTKTPVYRRSLSTLRSINDTEEQRAFDLPQPFCCTSHYELKGGFPLSTLENNAFGNVTDPLIN